MDTVHALLRRLRNWFLVWFAVEAILGSVAAAYVLDRMSRFALFCYLMAGISATGTVLAGIAGSLILLPLVLVVLKALLNFRPWARMVTLVVGWITLVSAAFNLVAFVGTSALFEQAGLHAGGDWPVLGILSAITNAADLAFWLWAIYVLQMNEVVREAFLCRAAPPEAAPTWPEKG